jgi:Cu/Ag efflux protein CusF
VKENKVNRFAIWQSVGRSAASLVLVAACFGYTSATLAAADATTDKSAPFVKESLHQLTATVTAVSMATREVTLRGEGGETQTIKVGPDARNLAQVKVGDRVTVSYYQGFTAQMRMHGKPNEGFQDASGAVRAAPGERPGGAAAQSTSSTVTIEKVDAEGNSVTFHRPDGVTITMPVQSPEGRAFAKKLKAGDVVDVMYTEALAVDVTEAAKAK